MNKNTTILILIIIFSAITGLKAQTTVTDSLENLLQQHTEKDTIRVNLLNKTANDLARTNIEKALKYANEAERLADKINFAKGKAEGLRLIGICHYYKSDYSKTVEYSQKSLTIFKNIGNKPGISKCLNVIGVIYYSEGNYTKAFDYYQEAMIINEEIGDKKNLSKNLGNIGLIYMFQGNYPHALDYFQKALKINEELNNNPGVTNYLNNIGIIYYYQKNYPKALEYYNRALKINEEMGDKSGISNCFNNIANIHFNEGNYSQALKYYRETLNYYEEIDDKSSIPSALNNIGFIHQKQGDYLQALEYFQKSLKLREKMGDKLGICNSYSNIGKVFLKTKNYTKALDYTLKSLKLANELDLLKNQASIHGQLSEIYAATKNYQGAYENQVLYKKLNDSIFNETNIKEITSLENKFEFEKEIQAIELEQQRKDAVQIEEARRQKTVRNSFIGGFLLMALLALIVLRGFLQKRKSNRTLLAQKNEIEEKNQQLELQKNKIQDFANELEKANETKDKFFSIIAHDLKSPFSSILGFSELLHENFEEFDVTEQKEFINHIFQSARNTYKLLENLLLWSRSQRGRIDFKPEKENLYLLIVETIKILDQTAASKSITLKDDIPEDIFVYADIDLFSTILRNLVSNAIKFTPKGGEVTITARSASDDENQHYTEISVKDTGVGISQEKQSLLFKISKNITANGTENETGTGLGLILCKEFVEMHNGKIWAESEPGKGSTFCFTLPG